jgi:osmoprotectant transport system substrate-binding protein
MRIPRTLAHGASLALLTGALATGVSAQGPTIRIGSDNFYESSLIAEIYAQVLEANGWTVERNFGLGSRLERAPVFEAGQIDLVPEYVGSGLGHYTIGAEDPALQALETTGDGETNRTNLQEALTLKGIDATVLGITPGEDTNAGAVRPDTAQEFGLAKMSDLAPVQDQLRWGLTPECPENPLCGDALEAYGITVPPAQVVELGPCSGPTADALAGDAIDFGWLCSTQPAIAQYGFVVLEDDLDLQPAENLAPLVRNEALAAAGTDAAALGALLDPVSATITTEVLTELGVKVAVEQQDIEDVAAEYLASLAAPPSGEPAASAVASAVP